VKLITSHDTADFDALASCVGLQKLDTHATIALGGGLAPNVHRFQALHRNRFPIERCHEVDLSTIDCLVVTDVRRRSRLSHVEPILQRWSTMPRSVRVVVWDHHPSAPDDLRADEEHVQPVGAVTTLVVEELRALRISVDPEEATLLALGIHEDTGSLVYSRTSSRDASALAWLLGQGARPAVIKRFLQQPLEPEAQAVLLSTLERIVGVSAGGVSVGVSCVELDEAPSGLAHVTTEAFRMTPEEALFCAFRLRNGKTHVIGRSQADAISVRDVLSSFGGGGHDGAGSAVVRGVSLEALGARLAEEIGAKAKRPEVVRDLMSSPVRTVRPDLPLSELAQSLREWGHVGAPVVRDGELVGVISRRDLERAQRAGRETLSVSSCMAQPVHTVAPDAPLGEARAKMTEHGIGRLPVLDGGRIVGIISRDDLVDHLYSR